MRTWSADEWQWTRRASILPHLLPARKREPDVTDAAVDVRAQVRLDLTNLNSLLASLLSTILCCCLKGSARKRTVIAWMIHTIALRDSSWFY